MSKSVGISTAVNKYSWRLSLSRYAYLTGILGLTGLFLYYLALALWAVETVTRNYRIFGKKASWLVFKITVMSHDVLEFSLNFFCPFWCLLEVISLPGCGMKIRADDPAAMKSFILSVQNRVNELKASSEDGQKSIFGRRVGLSIWVLNFLLLPPLGEEKQTGSIFIAILAHFGYLYFCDRWSLCLKLYVRSRTTKRSPVMTPYSTLRWRNGYRM